MTYPLSSAVSAGQPTAVDHYNNLRLDALFAGMAAADAVPLGTMLDRYEKNFNLVALSTNRVRCEASPTSVVSLMVSGYPVQAIANVDLPSGSAPSGAAATWYIFAVRSASSTTFTLDTNTSPSEWTNARLIGSCYWDGSAIVENSIITEYRGELVTALNYYPPQTCQGRLTVATGDALPSTDQSGGSIYFTPFLGNTISLYAPGFAWIPYEFDELTLAVPSVANQAYDIFLYDDSGLTLEAVAWASDTARTTAITLQDGRYCKNGALERLYLGSFRTKTAGVAYDQLQARLLFNYYNRRYRKFYFQDGTTTYAYAVAALRQMNATAANMVEVMVGVNDLPVHAKNVQLNVQSTANAIVQSAIGLDSTTTCATDSTQFQSRDTQAALYQTLIAEFEGLTGKGYHYLCPLEYSSLTTTFYASVHNQKFIGGIYA